MPTWSGILEELAKSPPEANGLPPFDAIRPEYLASLHHYTKRDVILYASKWTQHDPNISPDVISVVNEDLQGIMEVIHGLERRQTSTSYFIVPAARWWRRKHWFSTCDRSFQASG